MSGLPEGVRPVMVQAGSDVVATWEMNADEPTGPKALLVHGWNSRSSHMVPIAKALNTVGVHVVSLDLPGNGASSGNRLHMGKAIAAVDAAWRQYGPFDLFIGHSFGGQVILNAALGSSMCIPARRPKSLVLISMPNSMPAIFRRFGTELGLPHAVQEKMDRKVLSILGYPLDLMVGADQLTEMPIPVLVAHDMDDTDVLYSDALRLKRGGTHVELFTTNGKGHRRILSDAGLHARLQAWVLADRGNLDSRGGFFCKTG